MDTGRALRGARYAAVALAVWFGICGALVPRGTTALPLDAGGADQSPSRQQAAHDLDVHDLTAFVDALFADHMEEYGIPGAAFALVRGDEVLLTRGYGLANRERDIPVDPARTLFDIGSVTKLFTATAVMQLVEQGRVDLHADVNQYLTAFQVPDTYPEPVTLHHLLTHTAGFDDRLFLGMVAPASGERQPLAENLRQHLPPRVRPPGDVIDYSNYGITLAGHIVETVSGQRFDDYVTAHIVAPLGMSRTGFDVHPAYADDVAVAYGGFGSAVEPLEPWHLNHLPAGGLRMTVTDATAFMLAHLHGGAAAGQRILTPETVADMQGTQFRSHPAVSGIGYGFFEHEVEGRRAVQHAGDWVGTAAILYLLPDEQVGIFAAYNSGAGALARTKLVEALLARYFPVPVFDGGPASGASDRAAEYAGTYRLLRQDRHSFLQLPAMLLNISMEVRAEPDGTLATSMSRSPLFPEPLLPDARWAEVEPGVFREIGGTNTLAFDLGSSGEVGRLHVYWPQPFSFARVAWYQTTVVQVGLLLVFIGVLLVAVLGWPASAAFRRLRRRERPAEVDLRRARMLGGVISLLLLLFLIGFLLFFTVDTVGLLQAPPALTLLLVLPLLVLVLSVLLAVIVARLWLRRAGPLGMRLYHTIIVLALAGFFPYLYAWGLLGFRY